MRAQPAVLSAEDLLEQVWDEHADRSLADRRGVTISCCAADLRPAGYRNDPSVGYRVNGDGGTCLPSPLVTSSCKCCCGSGRNRRTVRTQ